MDFEDSGIESDPKGQGDFEILTNGNGLNSQHKEEIEPTISFVSNRCHFQSVGQIGQRFEQNFVTEGIKGSEKDINPIRSKVVGDKQFKSELQKRLEKRIAQANAVTGQGNHPHKSKNFSKNSNKSSMPSGTGSEKKSGLLSHQKLAIPKSQGQGHSSCGKSGKSENKPLVEWDSDESEEELGFFPPPKNRVMLTDNMSIDSMSLEDEDLHLSPPHQVSHRCPLMCPSLFERWWSSKNQPTKKCSIV